MSPRSAVCRNHAGSFEARDCAICSREGVDSAVGDISLVEAIRGDRAAFSVATIDSGRLCARSEDWEDCELGRRCQDKGEPGFLEGMALEGEGFIEVFCLNSGSEITRTASEGAVFSFDGEIEPVSRSIASSTALSRRGANSAFALIFGDCVRNKEFLGNSAAREAVGVLAGEDLVGEIDRARSESLRISDVYIGKMICHTAPICRIRIQYQPVEPVALLCLAESPLLTSCCAPRPPGLYGCQVL